MEKIVRKSIASLCPIVALCLSAALFLVVPHGVCFAAPNPQKSTGVDRSSMKGVPTVFAANVGQWDRSVLFGRHGGGFDVFFTREAVVIVAPDDEGRRTAVRLIPQSPSADFAVEGLDPKSGKFNYFKGNRPEAWRVGAGTYGAVLYRDLWPGIDVRFYNRNGCFEYDLAAHPGADLSRARFRVEGADELKAGDGLGLVFRAKGKDLLTQKTPRVYRVLGGVETDLSGQVKLVSNAGEFGFETIGPRPEGKIVVDPVIFSTYVSGSSRDSGQSAVIDASGRVYVAGATASADFPSTPGAYEESPQGSYDAFVLRLSPDGSELEFCTFLGGDMDDGAYALALTSIGNIIVTGYTEGGSTVKFPTDPLTSFDWVHNGGVDVFVAKLSADGSVLQWSTYIGGDGNEFAYALALDPSGNVVIAGQTESPSSTKPFPTLNAYQTVKKGDRDAFVLKLDGSGKPLIFSTYLGGNEGYVGSSWLEGDGGRGVAVSDTGAIYVAGHTASPDFPTAGGFPDTTLDSAVDGFLCRLSGSGALQYSTYFGGSNGDEIYAVTTGPDGYVYITGRTMSDDFPTTPDSFRPVIKGNEDAFVVKIKIAYNSLIKDYKKTTAYSTFIGGSLSDRGYGISVDAGGSAYVTGKTYSSDFPVFFAQNGYRGGADVFALKLSPDGTKLGWSTIFGGSDGADEGKAITWDSTGSVYVAGITRSTDFPVKNPYQSRGDGRIAVEDVFVAKLRQGSNAALEASNLLLLQ